MWLLSSLYQQFCSVVKILPGNYFRVNWCGVPPNRRQELENNSKCELFVQVLEGEGSSAPCWGASGLGSGCPCPHTRFARALTQALWCRQPWAPGVLTKDLPTSRERNAAAIIYLQEAPEHSVWTQGPWLCACVWIGNEQGWCDQWALFPEGEVPASAVW